jgi:hypothetical protein
MQKIPIVMICMHRTENKYVIIPYVEDKRFRADIGHGPLIRLSQEEMKRGGLAKVTHCFEEYMRLDTSEESEIKRMSDEQKREFERHYKLMSACLQKGSELWFETIQVTMPGWEGHAGLGPQFRTVVMWPLTDIEFYSAIVSTFAKTP